MVDQAAELVGQGRRRHHQAAREQDDEGWLADGWEAAVAARLQCPSEAERQCSAVVSCVQDQWAMD